MAVNINPVLAMISQTPGAALGQGLATLGQQIQKNRQLDLESRRVQAAETTAKAQQASIANQQELDKMQIAAQKQKLQANVAFGMYNLKTSDEFSKASEEDQQSMLDQYIGSVAGTMTSIGVKGDAWKKSFKEKGADKFLSVALQDPEIYKMINPGSTQKEWQYHMSLVDKESKGTINTSEKAQLEDLRNRREPTAQQVVTTVPELVQTEQVLDSLNALDNVANAEEYSAAVATEADAIRERGRANRQTISMQDSTKQAVSKLQLHMKPREGLAGFASEYVPGMAEQEYDPAFINYDVALGMLNEKAQKIFTKQTFDYFMSQNNLSAYDAIQALNKQFK